MPSFGSPVRDETTILFVVNDPRFFVTHRLKLACGVRRAGYIVHVAAPTRGYESAVRAIQNEGFPLHEVPIERQGINPLKDLGAFIELVKLYCWLKPHIVHHVTVKPVLYGSLAARIAEVPAVVNAISGLGRLFSTDALPSRLRAVGVRTAYRLLMRHPNMRTIFQNEDDQSTFVRAGIADEKLSKLIPGSGTEVSQFDPSVAPDVPPIVLFPARLLQQKGVREFVDAAQHLTEEATVARFVIIGDKADNRDAISERELDKWSKDGFVELWGWVDDMPAVMGRAAIICLPSYHEGAPKALIDACAAGRPIVATNIAGCRVVVKQGVNGLLVPPRDPVALREALRSLISDRALRERMGENGRAIAEEKFDIARVIQSTLEVYGSLPAGTRAKAPHELRRRVKF